ncbi:flagellar assembly protein FliW [Paenibacillus sp. SYP-B3998]|nr:flagellar assembly protein FliW [Paenibacillus sp. SYP-B3998]
MLGEINYEEEEVITFAQGIPGFEKLQRYLVIKSSEEDPVAYLQSIDESRMHFVITNPFYIHAEYEFHIDTADQIELEIKSQSDVEVWSILTTHEHIQETTINLLAPIIINKNSKQAKQIILHSTEYRTKHRLLDLMVAASQNEGE